MLITVEPTAPPCNFCKYCNSQIWKGTGPPISHQQFGGQGRRVPHLRKLRDQTWDLRPEVFTPNGRAPYLVTVGGAMTRDQAFALVKKGRAEGLPRDSYAQNYRR